MQILNGGIGLRKPLSRDTDDAKELYAWKVLEIQMPKDLGMLGREEINTDSSES